MFGSCPSGDRERESQHRCDVLKRKHTPAPSSLSQRNRKKASATTRGQKKEQSEKKKHRTAKKEKKDVTIMARLKGNLEYIFQNSVVQRLPV